MFASSFLAHSSTSRPRSPPPTTRTRARSAVTDAKAAMPITNRSTTRSRVSSSASTTAEPGPVSSRGYDRGNLLGDVSKVLRAQMRARARKAASSAGASPYSSSSSLDGDEMSVPVVTLPYLPTTRRNASEVDKKDKVSLDEAGLQPFPSSSPLGTPRLGPSLSRSHHSSIKSQTPRPSRSKSSRLAESLTRSSSKTGKPAAPISSSVTADLLTKHLAPLPRFDPFEKRRRSESLSAIVRKDGASGKENQKGGGGPASAAACRKMSSWSCLRAARKSDGCAPSIHLLAL